MQQAELTFRLTAAPSWIASGTSWRARKQPIGATPEPLPQACRAAAAAGPSHTTAGVRVLHNEGQAAWRSRQAAMLHFRGRRVLLREGTLRCIWCRRHLHGAGLADATLRSAGGGGGLRAPRGQNTITAPDRFLRFGPSSNSTVGRAAWPFTTSTDLSVIDGHGSVMGFLDS
jgi:hypothetical protein